MLIEHLKKANSLRNRIEELMSLLANKDASDDKAIREAIEAKINKLKKEFNAI